MGRPWSDRPYTAAPRAASTWVLAVQPRPGCGVRGTMNRVLTSLVLVTALAGCNALPRDAAGTTERIAREGAMRVAVLPGTHDASPALSLLGNHARRHDAQLAIVNLSGEHALRRLEDGELDAVVGHFAKTSPWMANISLSKPVGQAEPVDSRQPILRIARRNGENALILATDRAVAQSAK